MSKIEKKISDALKELYSSPLFNLSLSSKELFHSNFISWLAGEEKYQAILGKIFFNAVKEDGDNADDKYVIQPFSIKREEKHIDIILNLVSIDKSKPTIKLIIENKVKSLPYLEQLEEYMNKYKEKDVRFLLLTLSVPKHLLKNKDSKIIPIENLRRNWHLLEYRQFAKELKENIDLKDAEVNDGDIYKKHLLSDYVTFVNSLSTIEEETEIKPSEKLADWYSVNYDSEKIFKYLLGRNESDLSDITMVNVLRFLRLHDFYVKKKCENAINRILDKIEYNNTDIQGNSSIVNGTNGEFRLYYYLGRTTISIEVSRYYYRKLVHVKNLDKDKKAYKEEFDPKEQVFKFFKEKGWFNFEHVITKDNSYKPRAKKGEEAMLSFEDSKYLQCKLSEDTSLDAIIEYFKVDFERMLSLKADIEQEFEKLSLR
jgi:hypothetical protein